jgi:plastocyanin
MKQRFLLGISVVGLVVAVGGSPDARGVPPDGRVVTCLGQVATIKGTPGNDHLIGTPDPDVIAGRGGNDIIEGRGGNDRICGGDGDDVIFGGGGKDRIKGDAGVDVLYGDASGDRLKGAGGDDVLVGGDGADTGNGGSGTDTCLTETATDCDLAPVAEPQIDAYSFGYSPDAVVVPVNGLVQFKVPSGFHTATSSSVPAGATPFDCTQDCTFSVTVPGTYRYFCTVHGAALMSGTFVVEDIPNAPPVVGGVSGTLAYTAGQGATPIAPTATVEDSDSPDFFGGTLTVTLSGDDANDVLSMVSGGSIVVAGGSLKVGGSIVGSWIYDSGPRTLEVSFVSASVTATVAQDAIRDVAFRNTSGTPTPGERTAQIVLSDGDGGISDPVERVVDVSAV